MLFSLVSVQISRFIFTYPSFSGYILCCWDEIHIWGKIIYLVVISEISNKFNHLKVTISSHFSQILGFLLSCSFPTALCLMCPQEYLNSPLLIEPRNIFDGEFSKI